MKLVSESTDDKCDHFRHETTYGYAFAVDPKNKLALIGGQYNETIGQNQTTLVNLNDINNVVKFINIKAPLKWHVTNYEWDQFNNNSDRYLQTRQNIIEIINLETSQAICSLNGNSKQINDAKWSSFKPNTLASISSDFLLVWNVDNNKPITRIMSVGELDCMAWSKSNEHKLAVSSNNDIRIYDIRKTTSAITYIPNAHSKKIYSIDWCWTSGEEILISSSRDTNIKLWNFNMRNQNFIDKIIDKNFPCWKAKFLPFGLCFGVLPTCQSTNRTNLFHLNELANKYSSSIVTNSFSPLMNEETLSNSLEKVNKVKKNSHSNEPTGSIVAICQITALNETKINKLINTNSEMIMNFDFFVQNDKLNIASWSKSQHLSIHSLGMPPKDLNIRTSVIKLKEEEDYGTLNPTKQLPFQSSLQPIISNSNNNQTNNTTSSSRRNSYNSESNYSTPPSNFNSLISNRTLIQERDSFNLIDDPTSYGNDLIMRNSNNFNIPQNLLKSSSTALIAHEFLKKNPKCFGAKFTGLPEQMIIFLNQGLNLNSKANQKESDSSSQSSKRNRSSSNKINKQNVISSSNRHIAKHQRQQGKVIVLDISLIINVRRDLAEKYVASGDSIEKMCEKNLELSISFKKYDIAKIWELLKFITYNNGNKTNIFDSKQSSFSYNYDQERPWSCSVFGRTLVNTLIENCVLVNDFQTAGLIIANLKQYDEKANSEIITLLNEIEPTKCKNSTFINDYELSDHFKNMRLIDQDMLKKFDLIIKFYCEVLYKWGLYTKRVEIFEFLSEKPVDLDSKFEFNKRCNKCSSLCENSKCKKCNAHMMYCSICELPVNGLSIYCIACGHGGHYDHLFEWFKSNEDCPCACGCRCSDYI